MDHIPLPEDPISSYPRVPYVCTEAYDAEDFLEYPSRVGWSRVMPSDTRLSFSVDETFFPTEEATLEKFLQNWIFFGLLHALLTEHDLYDPSEFIEEGSDGGEKFVHTKKLQHYLEVWRERVQTLDQADNDRIRLHIWKCLQASKLALRSLLLPKRHPEFRKEIRTSLLLLCETISGACDLAFGDWDGYDWPLWELWQVSDPIAIYNMVQHGWCPREIAYVREEFSSIAGQLYIQQVKKPGFSVDHRDCDEPRCSICASTDKPHCTTCAGDGCGRECIEAGCFDCVANGCNDCTGYAKDVCKHWTTDPETYQPRHTDECRGCESIGPKFDLVAQYLDEGTFPVLEFDKSSDSNNCIVAKQWSEETPYVALSHVWADGLGNQKAMELPRCQLEHVQDRIDALRGCTFRWGLDREAKIETEPLRLWCDTVCCPVVDEKSPPEQQKRQGALKTIAIQRLKDVYRKAKYVLVLDQTLERLPSSSLSSLEMAVRITTSKWVRRLWTFQESVLSQKVLIQFADRAVDIIDIYDDVRSGVYPSLHLRYFARQAVYECIKLRAWSSKTADSESTRPLIQLQQSMRYRRVSFQSDEPICLATALGVDSGAIAAESTKGTIRIEMLWKMVCSLSRSVPQDIIFNNFPRLSTPGYRWAAKTLQESPDCRYMLTAGEANGPIYAKKGVLTDAGLDVCWPGWGIQLKSAVWPLTWTMFNLVHKTLFLRHPDGRRFAIAEADSSHPITSITVPSLLQDTGLDWHIILEHGDVYENSQRGVLGFLQRTRGRPPVFHSMKLVSVRRLDRVHERIHAAAEEHAYRFQKLLIIRLIQVMQICEDICAATVSLPLILTHEPTIFLVLLLIETLSRQYMFGPLLRAWGRLNAVRLSKACEALVERTPRSDELETSMKSVSGQKPPTFILLGNALLIFMGMYGAVEKVFDASHKWCVD